MLLSRPEPLIWHVGRRPPSPAHKIARRLERQIGTAADFGLLAATSVSQQKLMDALCQAAANGVEAPFAKLLVYQPHEDAFLLQAGFGWPRGIVGHAVVETDPSTTAGFVWNNHQSLVCNDLLHEHRFRPSDLLTVDRIVRSISVQILGDEELPFGVLEIETAQDGLFQSSDVNFLCILAQSFGAFLGRTACYRPEPFASEQSRLAHDLADE